MAHHSAALVASRGYYTLTGVATTQPRHRNRHVLVKGYQRACAWYTEFGRMSVADATRFDMLKKAATAPMSQMSRSVKPARRNVSRSGVFDGPRFGRELDGEIEHRALTLRQGRGAVVHHHQFAKRRIAGQRTHRCAMRDQAIVAAIVRGHRDRDHLALELAQARRRKHQIVVHGDEGIELRAIERIGLQDIRNEAELLVAFCEVGFHRLAERRRRKVERDVARIVAGRTRS